MLLLVTSLPSAYPSAVSVYQDTEPYCTAHVVRRKNLLAARLGSLVSPRPPSRFLWGHLAERRGTVRGCRAAPKIIIVVVGSTELFKGLFHSIFSHACYKIRNTFISLTFDTQTFFWREKITFKFSH